MTFYTVCTDYFYRLFRRKIHKHRPPTKLHLCVKFQLRRKAALCITQ